MRSAKARVTTPAKERVTTPAKERVTTLVTGLVMVPAPAAAHAQWR